jgi:hypothetical protein
MAFDSTIRLKQINQTELASFVSGIFSLFSLPNVSGSFTPSGSGTYNVGSSLHPYGQMFANQLNLASGSGINFGPTNLNAYVSGGNAYINIGGYLISSSGTNAIFIQGPSGATGASGVAGPSGSSGVGITGINYDTSSHVLSFLLSNGHSTGFNFQGLSGASGVSLTGFYQSGQYIFPQFDNFRGTGHPVLLIAGPPGPPGSISLNFQQSGTQYMSVGNAPTTGFPKQVIINPYYNSNSFPDMTFMRGMSYTLDVSGLNTHALTSSDLTTLSGYFSGQMMPFHVGDQTNYYVDSKNTGYWRLAFFPSGTPTGIYSTNYDPYNIFPAAEAETTNQAVYTNSLVNNAYRTKISFTTNFGASSLYQYGFILYSLGQDTTTDSVLAASANSTGFAIVVGNAIFSSQAGPAGQIGPSGLQGPVGSGVQGPQGLRGNDGADVVGYTYSGSGSSLFIQFQLANGIPQAWIPLPQGGPSGASGAAGTLSNNFAGTFNTGTIYGNDNIVYYGGSSYVNTGSLISGIVPPSSPWQILAQSGAIGLTGPTGATGLTGPAGSLSNHFSGVYSGIYGYPTNTVVTYSGSSFINTGVATISGIAPTGSPWQVLASGSIGPIGPSGVPGPLRPQNFFSLVYGNGIGSQSSGCLLDPSLYDMYSLQISSGVSGNAAGVNPVAITISGANFATGQSLIIKIRNINVPQNNGTSSQLFNLQSVSVNGSGINIKWPANQYSFPNSGTANIYTLLRFPDETGLPSFYGTYSNPYF